MTFDESDIKQYWKDAKVLKLIAVKDNEEVKNTVTQTEITLLTKWNEKKSIYNGTVQINLNSYTNIVEKISCNVE